MNIKKINKKINMEKLKGRVSIKTQEFVFEVELCFSNKPEDLKMEIDWYQKYSSVPKGNHYEIKIVSIPPIPSEVKLHIHHVKKEKFVCWTQQINTFENAQIIFKLWALGSVYTILTGIPFEQYLFKTDINGNVETFETHLSNEFHMKFSFI